MNKVHIFLTVALIIAALGCSGGKKAAGDGVYVGQPVSEFISIFQKQYKVESGVISLEGDDYPTYDVFENEELLFQIEIHSDRPEIVYRIWIYSPKIKTDKMIGIGSTYGEMKSKYQISGVSEEIRLNVWVEGLSATFSMSVDYQPNIDWGRLNKETMPESATIQAIMLWNDDVLLTTDKRLIARNIDKSVDAEVFTAESFMEDTESTSIDTEYAIRLADKTVLNQYSSYHGTLDENSEFGADVIIANTTVRDFVFFMLSDENRWEPEKPVNLETGAYYQLAELTPEKPFVTDELEGWQRGFSYVDEDNVRRFFSIEFDDNGAAYLLEFKAIGWTEENCRVPDGVDELISAIVNAFQNQDETVLNRLLHPDFGVVFYTMPGTMPNVFLTDKISFTDIPPGYTRMPTDVVITDYEIRYEQLPEFDCESGWSKSAGIYCYFSEATETRRIANLMTEYMEISWEAHETKIIDNLETKNHYTITVVSAEPPERMDIGISLEFTITLIDGKWYLTIVDIRGYCGA